MSAGDRRLEQLLGGHDLRRLRQRLRRCFERIAADETTPRTLRIGSLDAVEREALAQLTGQPPRDAKSIQVDLARVDAMLHGAGIAVSLRAALEQIDGPLLHPASLRIATEAAWSSLVAACAHPGLMRTLEAPAAVGMLKRLARSDADTARGLLDAASTVLERLPAGGIGRSQLAAEALGDAHGLDPGRAVATLVLAAWRQIERHPDAPEPLAERGSSNADGRIDSIDKIDAVDTTGTFAATEVGNPGRLPDEAADPADVAGAERSRDIWARAGVLVNELARPALLLNLPLRAGEAPLAAPGEPGYVSLRRLLRAPPRWAVSGVTVFVCENPNLVAIAADRLSADCACLICTDGMPAAAQRTLLDQLAQAGARLRYHGDFDWPGLQIANYVMRVWPAQQWRFSAADYEAAVASRGAQARQRLGAAAVVASWDAALAPAMQRHQLAIDEEAVAAALLDDLRLTSRRSA